LNFFKTDNRDIDLDPLDLLVGSTPASVPLLFDPLSAGASAGSIGVTTIGFGSYSVVAIYYSFSCIAWEECGLPSRLASVRFK